MTSQQNKQAQGVKKHLAIVLGTIPSYQEIDLFENFNYIYNITIITSESIVNYINKITWYNQLHCIAIPDYEENPSFLPGLEEILSKKYEVVIVKERIGLYSYQTVKAKWKSHFRLVVWLDNQMPFPGDDVRQFCTIREEVKEAADAYIVQTLGTERTLLIEGINEEKIHYVTPIVKTFTKRGTTLRAKALKKLGLTDSHITISHVGSQEWVEGIHDLLLAFAEIKKNQGSIATRFKLILCGVGSFSDSLKRKTQNLNIDNDVLYVYPSRDAYETILAASDAIYYGNIQGQDRYEGDPYSLLIAMANKIPIIAHRSCLVEELIGKHRLDFCAGSVDSLVRALYKLTREKSIVHDIVQKNYATINQRYHNENLKKNINNFKKFLSNKSNFKFSSDLNQQILDIELNIQHKQFIKGIDLIELIMQTPKLPSYHRANLYRLIGDCFTQLGNTKSGKNAYQTAIDIDPYLAKAHIGLGSIGLIKGDHDVAIIHFQKAISFAPKDEMANLGLGIAFHAMKEYQEATRWVINALKINPDNKIAIYTMVKLSADSQNYKDCIYFLKIYITNNPKDKNIHYTLAGILYKLGCYNESHQLTGKMLECFKNDDKISILHKKNQEALTTSQQSIG